MSAPIRRLEKLTINTIMPITRGQSSTRLPDPLSQADISPDPLEKSSSDDESSSDSDSGPLTSRADQVRDILSSLHNDILPSEFRQDIYDRIIATEKLRHINTSKSLEDCVMQDDPEATFFRLAAADTAMYECLCLARPAAVRALHFIQKLKRKMDYELDDFDALAGLPRTGGESSRSDHVRAEVGKIAKNLRDFVEIGRVDRRNRQHHERDYADCLLHVLCEVCNRDHHPSDLQPGGRRALRAGGGSGNLFQVLIGNAAGPTPDFALDALEELSEDVIAERVLQLSEVKRLLADHGAPQDFRRRVEHLTGTVDQATGPGPRSGQKRPASGNSRGKEKRLR